jgi:hypothetical protein
MDKYLCLIICPISWMNYYRNLTLVVVVAVLVPVAVADQIED